MDVFEWDNSFKTGLDMVDQQHHHLVKVTNQFGRLLAQDEVQSNDLEKVFNELVDYTQYHFGEEAKVMQAVGIDPRHRIPHEKEHQSFFNDVSLLHQEIRISKTTSERELFEFLTNWLIYHILGSDMNLARQVKAIQQGLSATEAYDTLEQNVDRSTASLLKALNTLFNQVTKRNRELAELNQTLESKVTQRTQELSEANKKLEQLAITDPLTGVANRRYAIQALTQLWHKDSDSNQRVGCMLVDADDFKQINDSYGHAAGDIVLCELAKQLQYIVRTDDIVCRLGGDEFLVVCPKTDRFGLQHLAERLKAHINTLKIDVHGGIWHGSISVGTAIRTDTMDTPEALIKTADIGVYAAKQAGRNCVKMGN